MSDTATAERRPVGRPRIGDRFNVRLPDEVREEVKVAAGFYACNESEFVRRAVERELARVARLIRLAECTGSPQ